jgi:hypothetical protein
MSILSSLTHDSLAVAEPIIAAESRYLTDGCRLFRRASSPSTCATGFVWLEDCQSLTVVLATADEVSQLTAVYATEDGDPSS